MSDARYSLGHTRITPQRWDDKVAIQINGDWQESEVAMLFVRRYWRALRIEPLVYAATGFARVREDARLQIVAAMRKEHESRKHAAGKLAEARNVISTL